MWKLGGLIKDSRVNQQTQINKKHVPLEKKTDKSELRGGVLVGADSFTHQIIIYLNSGCWALYRHPEK